MNYDYNRAWDEKINELLSEQTFTDIESHHATLWGYKIWTANYPYAAFTFKDMRPSRKTILKARARLEAELFTD